MKHFLLILFSTLIVGFSFFAGSQVSAEDPVPIPPVPCDQVRPSVWPPSAWFDTEFHSLRPYQKSPCNAAVSDTASFCGDSLTFTDNIEKVFPSWESCYSTSPGNVRCDYSLDRNATVKINLSGAELPIMGNTEDVINSQNRDSETLNDAAKVNEYVSWYLNGVVNRAEYPLLDVRPDCIGDSHVAGICSNTLAGICINPDTLLPIPEIAKPDGRSTCGGNKVCCVTLNPLAERVDILDRDKLVNYSGPLNKLLPQEVQQQQRAQTVTDAKVTRHDQIVGCTYGINIPLLGQLLAIPGPCYNRGLLGSIADIFKKSRRLSDFANSRPPIRADYPDYIDYEHAVMEWRGKGCVEVKVPHWVPIIGGKGIIWCFENLLNPNYVAQLYPNIPLSSTEDRVGQAEGNATVGPPPPEVTLSNIVVTSTAAKLYFSHMEETVGLAGQLQTTYLPKGVDPSAPGNSIPPQIGESCKILEVRSGAGDNLFADDITVDISYHADFSCDFIEPYCSAEKLDPNNLSPTPPPPPIGCGNADDWCSNAPEYWAAEIPYNLPYGDERDWPACRNWCDSVMTNRYPICQYNADGQRNCWVKEPPPYQACDWQPHNPYGATLLSYGCPRTIPPHYCTYGCRATVGGGECCPDPYTDPYPECDPPELTPDQSCTKSIPITVNITTQTPLVDNIWTRLVSGSASIFRKIFPKLGAEGGLGEVKDIPATTAVKYTGSLNGNSVPESAGQLNFPHIGGISEYFLKGIQTALRPKGFGEPISFGTPAPPTSVCDGSSFEALNPPQSTTSEARSYFQSYISQNLKPELVDVYAQAEQATGVPCEVLAGIHFIEGGNQPNASLQNGGPLTGTLLESAIQAGNELKAKVGGQINSWDSVITALSRYNGGGNSNCGMDSRYTGACPPPEGIDDPYATAWIDSGHLNMYLIYCSDYTKCPEPFPFFARPGALTVATEFYNTE